MTTQTTGFTSLDSRKRINLASFATRTDYKVTVEPSGRIILDPAVVLTEGELSILQNQELKRKVEISQESTESRPARRL